MKIEVRGYARDCGWTELAEADIASIDLPLRASWFGRAGVSMRRSRGAIRINKAPVRVTLNGRYHLRVELTKEEVRSLFLQMYADDSLTEAIAGLADVAAARRAAEAKDNDL